METFSRSMLTPFGFSASVQANAVEYPRTLSGRAAANDFTAGGYVMAVFEQIPVVTPDQLRYWNRIARKYSGGRAGIIVPLMVDDLRHDGDADGIAAPVSPPESEDLGITGIPHSDGALFSDGAGYSQDGTSGSMNSDHKLNSGTMTFEFIGDGELTGGEWFSIRHPNKNWRAYCIWTIDSVEDVSGGNPIYTVGIQPPLREATTVGTELDFTRPRFLGQLAPDTTMQAIFDASELSRGSVSFVERFEVD